MPQKVPVPPFSAAAQKALEDLERLDFRGNGHSLSMDATLAICTLFDVEYSAEDHLRPNPALQGSSGLEGQVRVYVKAMNDLKEHMKKREPFDIHTQNMRHVATQDEARNIALAALETLSSTVQNAELATSDGRVVKPYKDVYDRAQKAYDESKEWSR